MTPVPPLYIKIVEITCKRMLLQPPAQSARSSTSIASKIDLNSVARTPMSRSVAFSPPSYPPWASQHGCDWILRESRKPDSKALQFHVASVLYPNNAGIALSVQRNGSAITTLLLKLNSWSDPNEIEAVAAAELLSAVQSYIENRQTCELRTLLGLQMASKLWEHEWATYDG